MLMVEGILGIMKVDIVVAVDMIVVVEVIVVGVMVEIDEDYF